MPHNLPSSNGNREATGQNPCTSHHTISHSLSSYNICIILPCKHFSSPASGKTLKQLSPTALFHFQKSHATAPFILLHTTYAILSILFTFIHYSNIQISSVQQTHSGRENTNQLYISVGIVKTHRQQEEGYLVHSFSKRKRKRIPLFRVSPFNYVAASMSDTNTKETTGERSINWYSITTPQA